MQPSSHLNVTLHFEDPFGKQSSELQLGNEGSLNYIVQEDPLFVFQTEPLFVHSLPRAACKATLVEHLVTTPRLIVERVREDIVVDIFYNAPGIWDTAWGTKNYEALNEGRSAHPVS